MQIISAQFSVSSAMVAWTIGLDSARQAGMYGRRFVASAK